MRSLLLSALVVSTCVSLSGCGFVIGHALRANSRNTELESQVDASLSRYRRLVLDKDAERAADMFMPGGELTRDAAAPLVGYDQIRSYLKGFSANVTEYSLTSTSTKVDGADVVQSGTYTEIGALAKEAGKFSARWQRQTDGRWLLRRLQLTSDAKPAA